MKSTLLSAIILITAFFVGALTENPIDIEHIIEEGSEHPNAHFHGFVLTDVFLHHAASSQDNRNKISHTLTQRKLQFNTNRHLIDSTADFELFSNLTEEINVLDASPTLSRLKVRALFKLIFYNQDREGDSPVFFNDEDVALLDDPENELHFGASTPAELRNFTTGVWRAARNEINDIAKSIQASVEFLDAPHGDVGRFEIGIASLLFTRGNETILLFRDTRSVGDDKNAVTISTPAIVDTKSPLGSTQLMKRSWERAGLEWGKEQIDREEEPDWPYKLILPLGAIILQQNGFGPELADAVDGQQVGENGGTISLSLKESIQQAYWPVAKAVIEQVRKDLPVGGRILFSGFSQGGAFAELARMYTEKKYGEAWPVVTFGGIGAACFPRDLFGFGRSNYLDDVDPTKYYENVVNYNNFLDPYGGTLGANIGDTCYLGKFDIENNLEKSIQYKYCKEIFGYSMGRLTSDENLFLEPLRTAFKLCRFASHDSYNYMNHLGRDEELNEDGTTLGGCFQYEGAPLDSKQCPAINRNVLEAVVKAIQFVPSVLFVLSRLLL